MSRDLSYHSFSALFTLHYFLFFFFFYTLLENSQHLVQSKQEDFAILIVNSSPLIRLFTRTCQLPDRSVSLAIHHNNHDHAKTTIPAARSTVWLKARGRRRVILDEPRIARQVGSAWSGNVDVFLFSFFFFYED